MGGGHEMTKKKAWTSHFQAVRGNIQRPHATELPGTKKAVRTMKIIGLKQRPPVMS